jgi:hypothetical protein
MTFYPVILSEKGENICMIQICGFINEIGALIKVDFHLGIKHFQNFLKSNMQLLSLCCFTLSLQFSDHNHFDFNCCRILFSWFPIIFLFQ